MALVHSHVYRGVEVKCPGTPPCSKFHLVVCVCASRIEDNRLASLHVNSHVLLPQVSMDQSWSNVSPVGLKRTKKSRNHKIYELITSRFKFGPGSIGLIVVTDDVLELMGK